LDQVGEPKIFSRAKFFIEDDVRHLSYTIIQTVFFRTTTCLGFLVSDDVGLQVQIGLAGPFV
jgi:hypothetical protein